jgi:hypothetical protein
VRLRRLQISAPMTMQSMVCALIVVIALLAHVPEGYPAQSSGNPGWEAEWERTVKAAEQEGEVSYYTLWRLRLCGGV